jgi:multidrug efflux pump subunit AcrA (membrane-fusion protein)
MDRPLVRDLADCSEFRLTLLAKPPRLAHGTALLLVALLLTALAWLALARANLVVRAPGRMRPIATTTKVFPPGRGKVLGMTVDARIAEVNFREGDEVRRGDVLLRLETERLDNELAKHKSILQAADDELARLSRMEELLAAQHEASKAKLAAELAEATTNLSNEKEHKAADIQLAQVEVNLSRAELERQQLLYRTNSTPEAEVTRARGQVRAAEEKLAKAKVSVNSGRVEVLRHALGVADKDYQVRRAELALKRGNKEAERDATRLELANLQLEREQTVLRAPLDGVIIAGDLKAGDVLEAGKPALEIAAQTGFLFELAVPSDDVGKLRTDLPARIKLDAFDYQKYGTLDGTVCYIAPDSTLVKGQTAPIYLVKVSVARDEIGREDYRGRVKLGMAGQAEIITDQDRLLSVLLRTVRQSISLD